MLGVNRTRHAGPAPFFSVCIPQFNRTDHLLVALRTIAAQRLRDVEICISDDVSPEGRHQDIVQCLEETGLDVEPLELLVNRQHEYDHGSVDLYFWRCKPRDPAKVAAAHKGYRWVPAAELPSLKFPPANEHVISKLIAES